MVNESDEDNGSLTVVVDLQVVEDVVVGCPAGASREEHLSALKIDLRVLVDDFTAVIVYGDVARHDVHA